MHPNLTIALEFHRRGQLDEAARHYHAILAHNPDHADALHLLGVLAHQRGDHSQAIVLMERALTLKPHILAYCSNLAEAYRAFGQLERAESFARQACQLQPDSPDACSGLGLVLLAQNQFALAAEQFRAAVRLRPDFALAWNNLGNALRLAGDDEGTLAAFREAVRLDPLCAEAQTNLGQFLLEHRQPREALGHCQTAVRLRPKFPQAHSNLGNVLRELNRLTEAKECYAEALRLAPHLGMVHNNMAQALQQEGRLADALAWYHRALELDPTSPRIHTNQASALAERQRFDEALAGYQRALQLDPNHAEALNGIGWIRQEQGRSVEALSLYREALRLRPDLPAAHCNLGSLLEETGDLSGAESCFRTALGLDQRLPGAREQLAHLLRARLPEADVQATRTLLDDSTLTDGQRGSLHYGLAQVHDARGEYQQAAAHAQEANRLTAREHERRGEIYDPANHTHFVDRLIKAFSPEFFARCRALGSDSIRPIFIVGLPRSGTTLTEQILACHSQVFGGGELWLGRESFDALAPGQPEVSVLEALADLDQDKIQHLAVDHLARLRELNVDLPHVVDKMPDNYLYLGLLSVLFPQARFIHCRRDLRDVAVSCWMTHFRTIRWANCQENLVARFRDYHRLMMHWQRVLPVAVLEINYEETVADLEGVARRLVRWCGLEWEPACLAFQEGTRSVRTASVSQVRQPLYSRSVARWKHYEPALATLFGRLVMVSIEEPFRF